MASSFNCKVIVFIPMVVCVRLHQGSAPVIRGHLQEAVLSSTTGAPGSNIDNQTWPQMPLLLSHPGPCNYS